VTYEHPLAYVLGLEGVALLRAFTGEYDREFVEARLAEVRRLLDDPQLVEGVDVSRVDTVAGYGIWSTTYDTEDNGAFAYEPQVREIIEALPVGTALDAACGTGRYAAFLAELGHQVIGVDSSPAMLARVRTPGDFRVGDLRSLPVDPDGVDLVVCSLALTHVPDLKPVFAEFARVLRPGGHLVVADIHPEAVLRGSVPSVRDAGGRPGRLVTYRHQIGDYLRAALAVDLTVKHCAEPAIEGPQRPATTEVGPWDLWPWCLADLVPDATKAANAGVPSLVIWDFLKS
jgi:SAM-dependent methyltransferase